MAVPAIQMSSPGTAGCCVGQGFPGYPLQPVDSRLVRAVPRDGELLARPVARPRPSPRALPRSCNARRGRAPLARAAPLRGRRRPDQRCLALGSARPGTCANGVPEMRQSCLLAGRSSTGSPQEGRRGAPRRTRPVSTSACRLRARTSCPRDGPRSNPRGTGSRSLRPVPSSASARSRIHQTGSSRLYLRGRSVKSGGT